MVMVFCPAGMMPVSVPSNVPLPVASESVTVVEAKTFAATLDAFCDCTVTVNGLPCFGFLPPLIEVMASFEALVTVKVEALQPAPAVFATGMTPGVAPLGTVVVIWASLSTVNDAALPLNATEVAEVKPEPVRVTESPGGPKLGEKPVTLGAAT